MRLIRISLLVLALMLSAIAVFAQEGEGETRLADTYLHGGEFDSYTGFVTYWRVLQASPKDKRVCGAVGYNGSDCAFRFYGNAGEKTRLTQVTYPDFRYGSDEQHYGFFIARVKPLKQTNSLFFAMTFTFDDGSPAVKTTYTYTGTGPAVDYETVYFETESSFNPNTIASARINIRNKSGTPSSILIDNLSVGMNIVPPPTR